METIDPNNSDYPILHFDECPVCESDRRLANEILAQEVEAGKVPISTKAFLYTHQSVIAAGTWLTAPMIITFYDMCMDCGTVYVVHSEVHKVMQGGKPPKSGGGFSSS